MPTTTGSQGATGRGKLVRQRPAPINLAHAGGGAAGPGGGSRLKKPGFARGAGGPGGGLSAVGSRANVQIGTGTLPGGPNSAFHGERTGGQTAATVASKRVLLGATAPAPPVPSLFAAAAGAAPSPEAALAVQQLQEAGFNLDQEALLGFSVAGSDAAAAAAAAGETLTSEGGHQAPAAHTEDDEAPSPQHRTQKHATISFGPADGHGERSPTRERDVERGPPSEGVWPATAASRGVRRVIGYRDIVGGGAGAGDTAGADSGTPGDSVAGFPEVGEGESSPGKAEKAASEKTVQPRTDVLDDGTIVVRNGAGQRGAHVTLGEQADQGTTLLFDNSRYSSSITDDSRMQSQSMNLNDSLSKYGGSGEDAYLAGLGVPASLRKGMVQSSEPVPGRTLTLKLLKNRVMKNRSGASVGGALPSDSSSSHSGGAAVKSWMRNITHLHLESCLPQPGLVRLGETFAENLPNIKVLYAYENALGGAGAVADQSDKEQKTDESETEKQEQDEKNQNQNPNLPIGDLDTLPSKVESLYLQDNRIRRCDNWLHPLSLLRVLNLAGNQLESFNVPPSAPCAQYLEEVHLARNPRLSLNLLKSLNGPPLREGERPPPPSIDLSGCVMSLQFLDLSKFCSPRGAVGVSVVPSEFICTIHYSKFHP